MTSMTQTKPIVSIENVVASASVDQAIDLADLRHAASWQRGIDGFSGHDQEIISAAESSVTCQNLLLDSCYDEYC